MICKMKNRNNIEIETNDEINSSYHTIDVKYRN
jgi:hypothetical protein